ncbi:MAG: hypothetical protein HY897_12500 [Deltaproteobacteria bacterium]|nr:hypothetical protein [Deltaproteobacteria bacterium]
MPIRSPTRPGTASAQRGRILIISSLVFSSLVVVFLVACGPDFQQFLKGGDAGSSIKDTGGDAGAPEDGGIDASETPDTGGQTDTGADAGEDAGTDAAHEDTGPADVQVPDAGDAGADTGADAGADGDADAAVEDAGLGDAQAPDTGTDSGVGDAGADAGTDAGFDAGPQHYFARTYGAGNADRFRDIAPTVEGGFIAIGSTEVTVGNKDVWVVKLRADGTVEWQKRYGGAQDDEGVGIVETADGYAVAATAFSFGAAGDVWVLKLAKNGDIVWQKDIGGSGEDTPNSIRKTSTGFVIAGDTNTSGAGNYDALVVNLDENGNILWKKTFGGSDQDGAFFAQETSDGGFFVVGYSASFSAGNHDIWAMKLTGDGTIAWQKSYGGTFFDGARAGTQTKDGGFVIVGYTGSAQGTDLHILKTDKDGAPQWQYRFGGTNADDISYAVVEAADDGFVTTGTTSSYGTVKNAWVLKLAANGTFGWAARYGGAKNSEAHAVRATAGGGYVVAGFTEAYGAGGEDAWVLKIKADGTIDPGCPSDIGASTAVTPAQTSFAPVTTGASVGDPSVAASDTQASPTTTSVSPQEQCASQ